MKILTARKNRAFAVIIALIAVTVLTLMAGAFAYAMKIETKLAANTNDDEEFYWIARGGMERACWWLSVEGNQPYSSKQQYWAGGPGDGPETNSPLAFESLDNFQIGGGTVSLKMTELDSKININTADSTLLQRVLTTQGADANSISVVSDSVLDWIDPDDNTRPAGAESDYYLGLTPSYNAKNAVMDDPEELLLVKGVTYNMYYGISSAQSDAVPEHKLGFGHAPSQEPDYLFALPDVFTVFSLGQVNMNTADDNVLKCILGADNPDVQAIEERRESEPPIHDANALMAAVDQQLLGSPLARYFSSKGNTYRVDATVIIGQLSHTYTSVVVRNGPNVTVFSFYRSDKAPGSANP